MRWAIQPARNELFEKPGSWHRSFGGSFEEEKDTGLTNRRPFAGMNQKAGSAGPAERSESRLAANQALQQLEERSGNHFLAGS